uniref:Uncharacterized protein n=1 Tax=Arundo donax TaxID=35708 RepID=A0A0A8YEJ3_ARUDO
MTCLCPTQQHQGPRQDSKRTTEPHPLNVSLTLALALFITLVSKSYKEWIKYTFIYTIEHRLRLHMINEGRVSMHL